MKPGETNNARPEDLKNRMLRYAKTLLGVGFGTFLFLTAMAGQASGQKTPEVQTASSPVATQATAVAFDHSSLRWFEACSCKPASRGQTLISCAAEHSIR